MRVMALMAWGTQADGYTVQIADHSGSTVDTYHPGSSPDLWGAVKEAIDTHRALTPTPVPTPAPTPTPTPVPVVEPVVPVEPAHVEPSAPVEPEAPKA